MKEKKLVVLGCGVEQIPLISEIKGQGIFTVGLDGSPEAQALSLCDESHIVDITSADKIIEVLDANVAGILTSTEVALESCAIVARNRHLPGFSPQIVQTFRDKLTFAQLLTTLKLPYPIFAEISTAEEIEIFRRDNQLTKVVLKPSDGSGSRGVSILQNSSEGQKFYQEAFAASKKGKVIVQECLTGSNHSLECFVDNGRCLFIASTDKVLSEQPAAVVLSNRMPSIKHNELVNLVQPQINLIVQYLNISKAQINIDVIACEKSAFIIDVGLRAGGNYLQELIFRCYQFNSWQFYVSIFWDCPTPPFPGPPKEFAGCQFVFPQKSGHFNQFIPAKIHNGKLTIHHFKQKGEAVSSIFRAENRLAAVILSGQTSIQVDNLLSEFQQKSIIEIR